MIYLFSQIAISLALAAIVGATAGWLIHRAKAGKQIRQLQQVVGRQQQHVIEAQTEVSILSGDFDDLKHRADAQINELTHENQKIPALNQNLEKSQLLVRQLMQKHTAELTELTEEKQKLLVKSKLASEREKELIKLQAELDIERRKNRQLDIDGKSAEIQTELLLNDDAATEQDTESTLNSTDNQQGSATSEDEPDSVISAEPISTSQGTRLPLSGTVIPSAADTEAELNALHDQLSEGLPARPVERNNDSANRAHNLVETQVDEEQLEQLFDTVDQHDDLKQIFGIGPVTEKTLNKLGITAYSQLAELKQHDIEKIADALQIIPSRIERDNWVGGARSQLEEVLEEL